MPVPSKWHASLRLGLCTATTSECPLQQFATAGEVARPSLLALACLSPNLGHLNLRPGMICIGEAVLGGDGVGAQELAVLAHPLLGQRAMACSCSNASPVRCRSEAS